MHKKLLISAVGLLAATMAPSRSSAIVVADLKNDYKPAVNGQTSSDVGIPGTLEGSWHYYQDADGNPATAGDRSLLVWQTQSFLGNGGKGYTGTDTEFSIRVPIVSGDALFDGVPAPPAGFIMAHPSTNKDVAIEFRGPTMNHLNNVSISYTFRRNALDIGDARVLIYKSGNSTPFLSQSLFGGGGFAGTITGLGTLTPNDSLWVILTSGIDTFAADQTFLKVTVNADIFMVPEASSMLLVGLPAVVVGVGVYWRRRRPQR